MKTLVLIAAAAALVAGCATDNRRFYKADGRYNDPTADRYECERDTRMSASSFGRGFTAQYYAEQFFIRCMAAKGWEFG